MKYRASFNYYNTDGYLQNVYLDRKADPYRDYSGRLRLLWTPADDFSADLRFLYDQAETTAYYYVIPRSDEANPFSDFTTPGNANDTTSPIQNNNLGSDDRDIFDVALKLDYKLAYGTITSVTDFNHTKEIDTGDAYDFRPVATSVETALDAFCRADTRAALGGPFDESQSQFIDVQDLEPGTALHLTGGRRILLDRRRVFRPYRALHLHRQSGGSGRGRAGRLSRLRSSIRPIPIATNTNSTFLADCQNNNAWAVFGDATYEINKQWELDAALRYDEDQRQNTTDTPTVFLPTTTAFTGEVRKATFSATQPKGTLRFKPTDDWTFYGGWSRGFRSGGFNQTGVGDVARANGVLGVNDLFQAEIADTYEVGSRASFWIGA